MLHLRLTVLLALTCVACAPSTPESPAKAPTAPAAESQSEPMKLASDWPAGCRVPVRETLTKDGLALELTLLLRFEEGPAPQEKTARFENVRLLSVGGKPVPEAERAGAAAKLLEAPAVVTGPSGARLLDLDAHLGATSDVRGAELLRDPATRAAAEFRALERWRVYAGFWAGLAPDATAHSVSMPVVGSAPVTLPFSVAVKDGGGDGFSFDANLSDAGQAAGREAVGRSLSNLAKPSTEAPQVLEYHERYTAVVQRPTLRVAEVRHESRLILKAGARTVEQIKSRAASFDWSRASGCATE